jgi:hypothetical protein
MRRRNQEWGKDRPCVLARVNGKGKNRICGGENFLPLLKKNPIFLNSYQSMQNELGGNTG